MVYLQPLQIIYAGLSLCSCHLSFSLLISLLTFLANLKVFERGKDTGEKDRLGGGAEQLHFNDTEMDSNANANVPTGVEIQQNKHLVEVIIPQSDLLVVSVDGVWRISVRAQLSLKSKLGYVVLKHLHISFISPGRHQLAECLECYHGNKTYSKGGQM